MGTVGTDLRSVPSRARGRQVGQTGGPSPRETDGPERTPMNTAVEPIARALLYEGYVLYPYRADALKNRHRWTVGGLVPRSYSEARGGTDPWFLRAECLVECDGSASLSVRICFLHPLERTRRG